MTRRSYHTHCSTEGCSIRLNTGQLFCKEHYHSLPKALKDGLWASWRAAMNARRGTTPHAEQLAANRAYQAAYQACCEYLRTAPKTPAEAMTAVAMEGRSFASQQIEGGAEKAFRVRFVDGRCL